MEDIIELENIVENIAGVGYGKIDDVRIDGARVDGAKAGNRTNNFDSVKMNIVTSKSKISIPVSC